MADRTYVNPNAYPVSVTLSAPRRSVTLYPASWPAKRVPAGGLQSVAIDERVGRQLAVTGSIQLAPAPVAASAPAPQVVAEPVVQAAPEADPLSDAHPMRALERAQDAQALGEPVEAQAVTVEPHDAEPAPVFAAPQKRGKRFSAG